jgi:hypothetical protein
VGCFFTGIAEYHLDCQHPFFPFAFDEFCYNTREFCFLRLNYITFGCLSGLSIDNLRQPYDKAKEKETKQKQAFFHHRASFFGESGNLKDTEVIEEF